MNLTWARIFDRAFQHIVPCTYARRANSVTTDLKRQTCINDSYILGNHTLVPLSHVVELGLCRAMGHVALFPVQLVALLHSVSSLQTPFSTYSHSSEQQGPSVGL